MAPPRERKPRVNPGDAAPAEQIPAPAEEDAASVDEDVVEPAGAEEVTVEDTVDDLADAHPTEAGTIVLDVPIEPEPVSTQTVPVEAVALAGAPVADGDLAARLARLEAENAALRAKLATPVATAPADRVPHQRVRMWAAVALIAIGALLAPLGLVAHWAQRTLTDTDRYLETVAPLADDPQVQQAIINRTVTAVMSNIDVSNVTTELQDFLVQQGAPDRLTAQIPLLDAPLTSGVQTLVTKVVTRFVESDAFTSLWTQINRTAQTQIVAVLNGDPNTVVQLDDDGYLSLQLGPIIDIVKAQLVDAGIGIASSIPDLNPTVPVAQADSLTQLRTGYNILDTLGDWLPWIALLFLAAGVLVSTRRMRMTVVAALSLVGGMALLAIGLAIGKEAILGALPATASGGAVTVIFEQVVHFMKVALRMVAVVGLVVAFFAFIAGGSAAALATRRSAGTGFETVKSWGRDRGVQTGGFGVWLGSQRVLIRWVLIAIGFLVIIAADTPTAGMVVWTTVGVVVLIGIVELLSGSPAVVADATEPEAHAM